MSVTGSSQSWSEWASQTVDDLFYTPSEAREDLSEAYGVVKSEGAAAVEYFEQRRQAATEDIVAVFGAAGEAGSKVAAGAGTGVGLGLGTSVAVWGGITALAIGGAYLWYTRSPRSV